MSWFSRKPLVEAATSAYAASYPLDLTRPAIWLTKQDHLSIGQMLEGIFCTAQTGGGKSSAVVPAYLKACLTNGFGGLYCCAKPGDAAYFMRVAQTYGRLSDVVLIGPGHPDTMNILDLEARYGAEEVIRALAMLTDIAQGQRQGGGDHAYWVEKAVQIERAAVVMLGPAGEEVSLNNIMALIADLPREYAQMGDEDWRKRSYAYKTIRKALAAPKDEMQAQGFQAADTFLSVEFPGMGDRMQGSVIATVTGPIDMLMHGEPWRILANRTTVRPEQAYEEGKIFVLDMDIATMGDIGRLAQGWIKYAFQRQMLRGGEDKRPVFLLADEAQYFISSYDYLFQSVARGFRVSTLYLSQNIANLKAALGNDDKVAALIGSLTTHVYGCNTDTETNTFAAEHIGREWVTKTGWSTDLDDRPKNSASGTQHHEFAVQPHEFGLLANGGPGKKVQVIVHRAGTFSNRRSWIQADLDQF